TEARFGLVTTFCRNGALDEKLAKDGLPWPDKIAITRGAAAGMSFLHHMGIVHRDVAARNVLLGANNHPYISDFGMSRIVEEKDVAEGDTTKSTVGPVRWMAPEALRERRYSAATDAYSFGVLMWEVSTNGELPYASHESFADVIQAVLGGE